MYHNKIIEARKVAAFTATGKHSLHDSTISVLVMEVLSGRVSLFSFSFWQRGYCGHICHGMPNLKPG